MKHNMKNTQLTLNFYFHKIKLTFFSAVVVAALCARYKNVPEKLNHT